MTGQAFEWLEQTIFSGSMQAAGDPLFLGILVFGFFFVFVLLQGSRGDAKLLIVIPALFLAAAFVPWLSLVIVLGVGTILWYAITRFMNK